MNNKLENLIKNAINTDKELQNKKFELEKATIEKKYEDLQKRQEQLKATQIIDISQVTEEKVQQLQKQNSEYLTHARKASVFLGLPEFTNVVPLFARNLILLGAKTGAGKSTLTKNLTFQAIRQSKKVLIITNEENTNDYYNGLTALKNGWSYTDHHDITEEQEKEFNKMYPIWMQRVTIIDDSYNGVGGTTTTIEGIQSILNSLIQNNIQYDIIMIDYFQNISSSSQVPNMNKFEVLDRMGIFLDSFKNQYNAPLVVLAQLKEASGGGADSEGRPFKERIEGCKSIFNRSTCAMEVKANYEQRCTDWICHKSRFNGSIGKTVTTGFDRGRYITYTPEFKLKIAIQNDQKKHSEILSKVFKDNVPE